MPAFEGTGREGKQGVLGKTAGVAAAIFPAGDPGTAIFHQLLLPERGVQGEQVAAASQKGLDWFGRAGGQTGGIGQDQEADGFAGECLGIAEVLHAPIQDLVSGRLDAAGEVVFEAGRFTVHDGSEGRCRGAKPEPDQHEDEQDPLKGASPGASPPLCFFQHIAHSISPFVSFYFPRSQAVLSMVSRMAAVRRSLAGR